MYVCKVIYVCMYVCIQGARHFGRGAEAVARLRSMGYKNIRYVCVYVCIYMHVCMCVCICELPI